MEREVAKGRRFDVAEACHINVDVCGGGGASSTAPASIASSTDHIEIYLTNQPCVLGFYTCRIAGGYPEVDYCYARRQRSQKKRGTIWKERWCSKP